MNLSALARTTLKVSPGVQVSLCSPFEVSLACTECQRNDRTMICDLGSDTPINQWYNREKLFPHGATAICMKARHAYPVRVVEHKVVLTDVAELMVRFDFEYQPFQDKKHDKSSYSEPRWVRINFVLTCPQCSKMTEDATQTNLGRPFRQRCECGQVLYVDDEVPTVELLGESK